MSKRWKIALVAGGVALALLVGGVAVTGYAVAQRLPLQGPEDGGLPGPRMGRGHGGRWMGEGHEAYREQMFETLSEELGIGEEELETALAEGKNPFEILLAHDVEPDEFDAAVETATQEVIDQAVADEVMPQAVADWMAGHVTERIPPMGWMLDYYDEMKASVAEELGVSVEEMEAAHAEGKSPLQVAEELGIEPDAFHAAVEAAWQEAIDQAVAEGALTAEEGEQVSHFGPGGGHGRGCGFGHSFAPGALESDD